MEKFLAATFVSPSIISSDPCEYSQVMSETLFLMQTKTDSAAACIICIYWKFRATMSPGRLRHSA